MTRRAAARVLAAALALVALRPAGAAASSEEFSTFGVVRVEEDDEFLLDYRLMGFPFGWSDEWRLHTQALRTSQGCLTSGQWAMDTHLKVRAPLGRSPYLRVDYDQHVGFYEDIQNLDFWFVFPTRVGSVGGMFRPRFDKSQQDFALGWMAGADTTPVQVTAVFGLEDGFNNLWAWRQTRVGETSQSYLQHPWEPALYGRVTRADWRVAASGKWLTKGVKRVLPGGDLDGPLAADESLWGALADGEVGFRALGLLWDAAGYVKQAKSTSQAVYNPGWSGAEPITPADSALVAAGDGALFRARWSFEAGVTARLLGARVRGSWYYQERREDWSPPQADGSFFAVDRLLALDANYPFAGRFDARAGALYSRITNSTQGTAPALYYGTRNESRIYVGLEARFGRVSVMGIEGIELDPEPYDVWLVHDKGFLLLQALF